MILDKKLLFAGLVMMIIGGTVTVYLNSIIPTGTSGMTPDEILYLKIAEQENQDSTTLAGIIIGVGFLLVLVSFGTRRKKSSGAKKIQST